MCNVEKGCCGVDGMIIRLLIPKLGRWGRMHEVRSSGPENVMIELLKWAMDA